MRTAGRRPRVTLGADTLDRLEALAQGALRRNPGLADRLLEELGRARIVPAEKLPSDVVAIGRSVTYRDVNRPAIGTPYRRAIGTPLLRG
ncbi:hypothetical protein GCM10011392_00920 [Wenxinia marina]|nr:hypothetical protein [Wenxinia marina]GGL50583.1 hypothetical protein GCM10011392_00920 [Wenxinia marina]